MLTDEIFPVGKTWPTAASLVIAILIVWGTWGLLRESFKLSLDAVPESISRSKVDRFLRTLPGMTEVHDLLAPASKNLRWGRWDVSLIAKHWQANLVVKWWEGVGSPCGGG